MWRPTIKLAHRPVRYGAGHVRIGGVVPGIRGDLIDRDGWVWALLSLLDGTRTVERIATELAVAFPATTSDTVRTAVAELAAAGHLEDAARPDLGLGAGLRERHSRGRELLSWMDQEPRRTGWEPQVLLGRSAVVVLGLGGVGCTAALDLVLAGIGRVHCVDRDRVEHSNLNRQALFGERDVGAWKVDAGTRRLHAHNSAVEVTGAVLDVEHPDLLGDVVAGFDVVVLAADQPREIRSWVNRACLASGKPWVHGGYHGPLVSIGFYRPGTGPCADCAPARERDRLARMPARTEWPPAAGRVIPHAANAVSAGLAGTLAAHAALSLLTGVPRLPANRTFAINLVTLAEEPLDPLDTPNPLCPSCGA